MFECGVGVSLDGIVSNVVVEFMGELIERGGVVVVVVVVVVAVLVFVLLIVVTWGVANEGVCT